MDVEAGVNSVSFDVVSCEICTLSDFAEGLHPYVPQLLEGAECQVYQVRHVHEFFREGKGGLEQVARLLLHARGLELESLLHPAQAVVLHQVNRSLPRQMFD